MTTKPSPDTTSLVESYRVKLGLAPWLDHAKTRVHVGGRGSGKTTRMILEAIAATIAEPDKLAVIATLPSSAEPVRRLLRDTAERLGVDASRVHVRCYRWIARRVEVVEEPANVWCVPTIPIVPRDPEQRHWILRAHDQGLTS